MTSYNARHNAFSSPLGKRDQRRAEARRRLNSMSGADRAALASSLGVSDDAGSLVRHAAQHGLGGWPKRRSTDYVSHELPNELREVYPNE